MKEVLFFKKRFLLKKNETVEGLSKKIHLLELENFPVVIEKIITSL